jgi:3-oxoacyl-[acyl-carrier-protein] synthase-3
MPRAHIVGWGKYVPQRVLTNDDLSRMVDTSDEWIVTRTGIRERHLAEEGETTATMAVQAARQALDGAGIGPEKVDLIIVATATPDYLFPSTACLLQDALGARRAGAFDLAAGCTGFIYALGVAAAMIESGAVRTALVIGAETLSRITDWTDRNTCVLFGDGAGAVVLQAGPDDGGVLATVLGADGSGSDLLMLPAGGSRHPASHQTVAERMHYIKMQGRDVFRFAVRVIPSATRQVLERAGLSLDDVSPVHPPSGERAHHRERRPGPEIPAGEGLQQPGTVRQHFGGVHPHRPLRGGGGGTAEAGGCGGLRGLRGRADLGCDGRPVDAPATGAGPGLAAAPAAAAVRPGRAPLLAAAALVEGVKNQEDTKTRSLNFFLRVFVSWWFIFRREGQACERI